MTTLLKRLSRLSGDNPVQWVKVTPDDWAELGAMLERAQKYDQLLYAVVSKFPSESRHETALRYIVQRELSTTTAAQATNKESA